VSPTAQRKTKTPQKSKKNGAPQKTPGQPNPNSGNCISGQLWAGFPRTGADCLSNLGWCAGPWDPGAERPTRWLNPPTPAPAHHTGPTGATKHMRSAGFYGGIPRGKRRKKEGVGFLVTPGAVLARFGWGAGMTFVPAPGLHGGQRQGPRRKWQPNTQQAVRKTPKAIFPRHVRRNGAGEGKAFGCWALFRAAREKATGRRVGGTIFLPRKGRGGREGDKGQSWSPPLRGPGATGRLRVPGRGRTGRNATHSKRRDVGDGPGETTVPAARWPCFPGSRPKGELKWFKRDEKKEDSGSSLGGPGDHLRGGDDRNFRQGGTPEGGGTHSRPTTPEDRWAGAGTEEEKKNSGALCGGAPCR